MCIVLYQTHFIDIGDYTTEYQLKKHLRVFLNILVTFHEKKKNHTRPFQPSPVKFRLSDKSYCLRLFHRLFPISPVVKLALRSVWVLLFQSVYNLQVAKGVDSFSHKMVGGALRGGCVAEEGSVKDYHSVFLQTEL